MWAHPGPSADAMVTAQRPQAICALGRTRVLSLEIILLYIINEPENIVIISGRRKGGFRIDFTSCNCIYAVILYCGSRNDVRYKMRRE